MGGIGIMDPLPLIVVNEEGIDIIGRVYTHFQGNPYLALEWLCTKNKDLDNQAPLFLMNYGHGLKVLNHLKNGGSFHGGNLR